MFFSNFIFVPSGEKHSGYEKLLLPFDVVTWVCILITFSMAYTTVFLLNFTKPSIKTFVFGKNDKTPSLNIAIAFFVISQTTLPRTNFARYLLMTFIMYSMIIRTAYQGKMFEFMQKNTSKPGIQSFQELIEKDYTLYMRTFSTKIMTLSNGKLNDFIDSNVSASHFSDQK